MQNENKASAMPELALAILDKLTGLNAELSFDFNNMELELPAGGDLPQGQFKLNGTLRIRTKGNKNQL
jgi:hypothetical protein